MKAYCIVVTYNAEKWLDKCFGSLRDSEFPIQTIAVDNGSKDNTIALLKSRFPEVEIIQPEKNLGFGKGNNVGIARALEYGADFVYLLNQDAYLLNGSIKTLLEAFDQNPQAGLISPIHLAGDERNLDFGFYKYVDPKHTPYFLGDILRGEFHIAYETKYINAAAWMLRASMIRKIGMFHPVFDHYGEDREYISRMGIAGYKSLICSRAYIVHDRPQERKGNDYHQYGQTISRDLLQGLIEKKITYRQASYRLFKLFMRNLVTLEFRNVGLIINGWIWVTKKNRLL